MTFQAFLHDPKSYLSTHEMYIANSPAALACMTSDVAHALPGGLTRQRWHQRPAGPFPTFSSILHANPKSAGDKVVDTLRHLPFAPRKTIQYSLGNTHADLGLRYLPFNENHVTYMYIHGGAQFVMTGPLTGCTIAAVADPRGGLWFIHSNQNAGAGMAAARLAQMTGINDLVHGHMGLNMANVVTCQYGIDYDGFGFVFGLVSNASWKFYSHATTATGNTSTRIFGEL
jgi:hypothetical protein